MKLSRLKYILTPGLLAAGAYGVFAVSMCAQVQTESMTRNGQTTHDVKVERAEVVYVTGNDLVVKMEDGTIRHIPNVPESAKVNVDGKELGIHDLKPGMKLQRTITTTTTPKMVTTVQSVTGKVWQVSPPNSVILTLEDNTNQKFSIPKGQKFTVDGQQMDAFGLRKGMMVSATKVVEVPETVVEQQRQLTGKMPPPPAAPPADTPILVVMMERPPASTPAPATQVAKAEPAPASTELPKTGSMAPLVGLLGLISLTLSLGIGVLRRFC
jgi:LPXTG-motif cell wall-anchored protein